MEVLSPDPHTSPHSHLCIQLYPSCSTSHSHLTTSSIQHSHIAYPTGTLPYSYYPSDSQLSPCNTPLRLNTRLLTSRYTFIHEGPHVTLLSILFRLTQDSLHVALLPYTSHWKLMANITSFAILYCSHLLITGITCKFNVLRSCVYFY